MLYATPNLELFPQRKERRNKQADFASYHMQYGIRQYHFVWVMKYRYKILYGPIGQEVYNCIQVFAGHAQCEILELNVQSGHINLVAMAPPKVSLSNLMSILKESTAIGIFKQFTHLRKNPYWGNLFWAQ